MYRVIVAGSAGGKSFARGFARTRLFFKKKEVDEMNIDLHMHSAASDGQLRPAELMRACREARLDVVALTDHDTVAGLAEAQEAARSLGIQLIPGIELNADDVVGVHILGLGIDPESLELLVALRNIQEGRRVRAMESIRILEAYGWIVEKSILDGSVDSITRPAIARAVQNRTGSLEEFMNEWLVPGRPAYVDRERFTAEQAIRVITAAGGKPVWAHPGYSLRKEPERIPELADRFVGYGLCGLEVFYSKYSREQTEMLYELTLEHRLCESAGSDFHGYDHPCNKLWDYKTYGLPFDAELIVEELILS